LGSLTGPTRARQAFIDDSRFAARDAVDPASISATSIGASLSTINGQIVTGSQPGNSPDAYLVTGTDLVSPGLCRCQYLQWGVYGYNYFTNNFANQDRAHL